MPTHFEERTNYEVLRRTGPLKVLNLKGGWNREEREKKRGGQGRKEIPAGGQWGVFSARDSRKLARPFLEAWATHRHGILQKRVHLAELQVHVSPANSPQQPLEGSHPLPVDHASCEPRQQQETALRPRACGRMTGAAHKPHIPPAHSLLDGLFSWILCPYSLRFHLYYSNIMWPVILYLHTYKYII